MLENLKPLPEQNAMVCPSCNQEKPLTLEFWYDRKSNTNTEKRFIIKSACRSCLNEHKREGARIAMSKAWKTPEGKERMKRNAARYKERNRVSYLARRVEEDRRYRLRLAEKAGREVIPKQVRLEKAKLGRERKENERAAVNAWTWWIKQGAPEQWVEAYWRSHGKPWLNPRLSDGEAYKLKYRLDEEFAINERLRRQLRKHVAHDNLATAVRNVLGGGKGDSIIKTALGCSAEELRVHFERQFTKGMSWDLFKQGKIHIDHIIPVSQFDLNDPEQFKACWSLPNLRPLLSRDNISKSNRVLFLL